MADSPAAEWLDSKDSAALLGIPEPTFKLMAKQGQIPDGRKFSNKVKRWNREVVMAISVLIKIGFLPMTEVKEKADEDDSD